MQESKYTGVVAHMGLGVEEVGDQGESSRHQSPAKHSSCELWAVRVKHVLCVVCVWECACLNHVHLCCV